MTARSKQAGSAARVILVALAMLALAWFFWPRIAQWRVQEEAVPRTITPRGDLAQDELNAITVFERSNPSVAFITTSRRVIDLFDRNVLDVPQGSGSGFVWDDHGHIVTNFHVIAGAERATVRLAGEKDYEAELVGASPEHDLAVLRIRAGEDLGRALPVGTSADLKVGQKVYAIGNPFGLDQRSATRSASITRFRPA
jgi:S1-C subfamily serine protease